MIVLHGIDDIEARIGQLLGTSPWHTVTQASIDRFADETGDHYWIHTDPVRAATSPYGGTIAHGLLTLSLGSGLGQQIYEIVDIAYGVNYGYGKVRFPGAVPVNSRIRMSAHVGEVARLPDGARVTIVQTFECEGVAKPVCVAESLLRLFG